MTIVVKSDNPTTVAIADLPICVLDKFSGARFGFAMFRLRNRYTGPAVRVRRTADDTAQDFGFKGNRLDTDALEAWVGNGNGFVERWYDQSGSGLYLSQTTLAYQLMLVQAGQTLKKGGVPYMYADGSNDRMGFIDAEVMKAKAGAHIFTVCYTDEPDLAPLNARVLFTIPSDTGAARVNITDEAQAAGQISAAGRRAAADSATVASIARATGTPMLVSARYDFAGGKVGISVNAGAEVTSDLVAGPTTNTTTTWEVRLCSSSGNPPGNFWLGGVSNIVAYESVRGDAAAIKSLIMARSGL